MKNYKFYYVVCCIILLTLCGCTKEEDHSERKIKQETIQDNEDKTFVEPYIDENPIQLGLYQKNGNTRTLVTELNCPITQYQDIISLETYYTKEPSITGIQKTLWNQYYQTYQNIDSYKIGYHIAFETSNMKVNKIILNPSDVESFFDYVQIYLYDDIHQDSSWYDHITTEEVTEETRYTSIKLTASTKIDELTTPINLMVFTYDEDDFNEEGQYRGNSKYQVIIKKG